MPRLCKLYQNVCRKIDKVLRNSSVTGTVFCQKHLSIGDVKKDHFHPRFRISEIVIWWLIDLFSLCFIFDEDLAFQNFTGRQVSV